MKKVLLSMQLFENNVTGIVSMADNFIFDKSPEKLLEKIHDFLENDYSEEALRIKYQLGKNYAKWILESKTEIAKVDLTPVKIAYRPFDDYYTIFSNKLLWRWRIKTMQHFLKGDNLGLVINKPAQGGAKFYSDIFLVQGITDQSIFSAVKRVALYMSPLYLPRNL